MSGRLPGPTSPHTFRDLALLLRGRSGLTQHELAELLGVSERAVQKWEAGLSYPSGPNLKGLIAVYLAQEVFAAGQEHAEAAALWDALRRGTSHHTASFDQAWFAAMRQQSVTAPSPRSASVTSDPAPNRFIEQKVPEAKGVHAPSGSTKVATAPASFLRWQAWGEAPDITTFYGRAAELAAMARWLLVDHCRLVAMLGMGGCGKTALATRLAHDLVPQFEVVFWRSLRNAPPVIDWLAGVIGALAGPDQGSLPEGEDALVALFLGLLRERRCLLVLDNLETVLEPGEREARYREGYEGYGTVLQRVAESGRQSCLVVTSREKPPELELLEGKAAPVRTLWLEGLGLDASRSLLQDRGLDGDDGSWMALVARYGGNALALKVVGATIATVFGGDIAAFLAYVQTTYGAIFGGVRALLDAQVARSSALERTLLYWLAVEREPVELVRLAEDLEPPVGRGEVLEALEALRRRSLLERGGLGATVTLQPVVLEHVGDQLVSILLQEIVSARPLLLRSHAVEQAQAKDYVRQAQERLLVRPLIEHLVAACRGVEEAEQRLLALLRGWQGSSPSEQGYGPGNVVNLLRQLRGHLRQLDLSRLVIRQAYLQEVEAQDTSLVGAHLMQTVLAEAFDYSLSVALSSDGKYLAAGTMAGEVRVWRVVDRTPVLTVRGHAGVVLGVALSGDGRLLASCGADGTVRLWDFGIAQSGAVESLATLEGHSGAVFGVALSGNGHVLVTGGTDGTVLVWDTSGLFTGDRRSAQSTSASAEADAKEGRVVRQTTLQGHSGGVWRVALSGDGRLLASGGGDGMVNLWSVADGDCLKTAQAHTGGVWDVALSEDGRLLASGGADGNVKVWDFGAIPTSHDAESLVTLQGHTGGVQGVALSGDGQLVVSGSLDGTVKLWATDGGMCLVTLQGHSGVVQGVALSADGRLFASGGGDGLVKLWACPREELWRGSKLKDPADSGRLSPLLGLDVGDIGAAQSDGYAPSPGGTLTRSKVEGSSPEMLLQSASRVECLATLQGHSGGIFGMALSGDGQLLATGGMDGTVKLVAADRGECRATLRGHTGGVWRVAMTSDGRLLASGGGDGTVKLWAVERDALLMTLQAHSGGVWGVALSGDGRLLASGGVDGTVKLWNLDMVQGCEVECLATIQGHSDGVRGVALSGDGCLLASGGGDGTIKLWTADTVVGDHTAPLAGAEGLWRGPKVDGPSLIGYASSTRLQGWRALATLHGHPGVWDVALSGDGRLLASGGGDGTIKLWQLGMVQGSEVECLASLLGHTGAVHGVALSDDGRLLVSGGADGTVTFWDIGVAHTSRNQPFYPLRTIRTNRPYERMDISGLTGVTAAQRAALFALGAVE